MQQSQSKVFFVTCIAVVALLVVGLFAYKSYKASKSITGGENSTVSHQQTTTMETGSGSAETDLNNANDELNSLQNDENSVDSGLNDTPDNLQ